MFNSVIRRALTNQNTALVTAALCSCNCHLLSSYRIQKQPMRRQQQPCRTIFTNQQTVKLERLGVVQPVKSEPYVTGQLFVHRLFGYRGIVLTAYPSRLHKKIYSDNNSLADVETCSCLWYLVLRDTSASIPNLVDGLTFLPHQRESSVFCLPGMDYVDHSDIVPYELTADVISNLNFAKKLPIDNEFFTTFFQQPALDASKDLHLFLDERKKLLEVSSVHQDVTDNIRVTAIPFFMGRRQQLYYWRYVIRLENLSPASSPVVLRERCWSILCVNGVLDKLKDRGVVGTEPLLNRTTPLFQYYSHISLKDKWGNMTGHFKFERPEQRAFFDVKIPSFPLQSSASDEEVHMYTT